MTRTATRPPTRLGDRADPLGKAGEVFEIGTEGVSGAAVIGGIADLLIPVVAVPAATVENAAIDRKTLAEVFGENQKPADLEKINSRG